ncbi:MAG: exosortase/archaeosortase family protein [Candidatus Krumholzibacteriota bacterium]|nr:exosortase/archaeosortase family protein [Candidatus Krumholzibacteriota bacterium]
MSSIADHDRTGSKAPGLILIASSAVLISILYFPVLLSLVRQWINDPNYQHGLIIPFVSAFILWKRREKLKNAPDGRHRFAGLLVILFASLLLIAGTAASELFTTRFSFPILIFGTILFIFGDRIARVTAFPVLFLILAIPLPYIIYYKITFPMQIFSARLSTSILKMAGVSIIRKGNILQLPEYTLEVVAACSGLRSLMTMVTIAMIFTVFSGFSRTKNLILVAASIPVAIAANAIRLTITALGAYTIGPEFADGPIHEISGLIVFVAGMLLLLLCARILKWVK